MPLLKNNRIIEDTWTFIEDEAEFPDHGNIGVSFERLKDHGESLASRDGGLGVHLNNDIDALELAPYIKNLGLIALHFPAFTDGRAYSQARIITTQLNFTGELRATGNVLVDQGVFMARCGFDAFEIDGRQPAHQWARIANIMSLAYQRGYKTRTSFSPHSIIEEQREKQSAE